MLTHSACEFFSQCLTKSLNFFEQVSGTIVVIILAIQHILEQLAVKCLIGKPIEGNSKGENFDDFIIESLIELFKFNIVIAKVCVSYALKLSLGGKEVLFKNALARFYILF